jgi:hypothetical protein
MILKSINNLLQKVQQMQKKRFKYEKVKRPDWIFNAKWCEGRPWLKYDRDENVMTCTICTKYGKQGETGNLNNLRKIIVDFYV